MLYRLLFIAGIALITLTACQDGIPTRHPGDGQPYWETTIPMRDVMTWDEWCTTLGAFLTQGSALKHTRRQLDQIWKESARAGGMTQQQFLESQEYCGDPWQHGADPPSFTKHPALHFKENKSGLLPPRLVLPPDEPPTHEELMVLWGVGHTIYAEGHHKAGFTSAEIGTAWMRATRLMGFTWDTRNEALRNYHKAADYDYSQVNFDGLPEMLRR